MRYGVVIGVVVALLAAAPVRAEPWAWATDGSLELFSTVAHRYGTAVSNPKTDGAWLEKVRLNVRGTRGPVLVELGYEMASQHGGGATLSSLSGPLAPTGRADDLNPVVHRHGTWTVRHNLDRLRVSFPLGRWEATVGRQAIGHGSGRYFNPTDIAAPLSPFSTNTEWKAGVDGVRLSRPLGLDREVEVAAVTHRNGADDGTYLLRYRKSGLAMDYSLLAGVSRREPTLAVDLSGDLGGTGWYSEGVYRFGRGRSDTLRAMAGLHRFWPSGFQAMVEVHHNGAGGADPAGYLRALASPEWQNGETFLLGRWFTAVLMGGDLTPLWRWNLLAVRDHTGSSTLLSPGLSWDFREDVQVRLGAQWGLGRRPLVGLTPLGASFVPASDFGLYPTSLFVEWLQTF